MKKAPAWAVFSVMLGLLAGGVDASSAKKEEKKPEKKEEKKHGEEKKEKTEEKKEEPKKEAAHGAHGKEKKEEEPPRPPTPQSVLNEIAAYARLARQSADQGKWPLTEHFLQRMVDLPALDEEKKAALLEVARTYELHENFPKAIAMYEQVNKLFSGDPDQADRLLALGRLYRKIGANQLAIARFYNVLNATLTPNGHVEASRVLTQRAQAEIADTHFAMANYPLARRFYELLNRLELDGPEKARVRFRLAHTLYLLGEIAQAGAATQQFIEDSPDDPSAPEARYILALCLRGLNHPKDAYDQIIALLKEQDDRKRKAPDKWLFWQKKAGNEFANELYQKGEYMSALNIYQSLATLSTTPEWQWPVVYQMGLCFEKLRIERRAAEAYKFIVDESKKPERKPEEITDALRTLVEMAQWRGEQLVWKDNTVSRLDHVLGAEPGAESLANKTVLFR